MADNLGPNGLVVSAGKCAGPIPAENCANAQKILRPQAFYSGRSFILHFDPNDFLHEVQFSAAIGAAHFPD